MDFFEAQARAKKRTSHLVVLFAFAVAGTIAAAYFAAVFTRGMMDERDPRRYQAYGYASEAGAFSLWQPGLLLAVALGTLGVVGMASLIKWKQYSDGGSAVAESVGGRLVHPHTTDLNERRLLNVVEEMAIASGIPVPAVYILDEEPALNAFAAGLTTSDAVVAVTRGTLEKLTRDELQGVVGHEFSHILNGDMRLNLRLTALLFGILVLGLAGRGILWTLRGARFTSRRDKNSSGILAVIVVVGLALLIIGYIGYFFGRLIQAAVSRQREFLADASAVQFTRNPAGLSGALKKIGGYALGSSLQTSKAAAIGHFFFAQSFRSGITGLWSTHPSLDQRIRAIEPQFDGKMFEPEETVDVREESFVSAGLAPAPARRADRVSPEVFNAAATIATIGTLSSAQIDRAEALLAQVPARLRDAARSQAEAQVLIYALLLSDESAVRERQLGLVTQFAGSSARSVLESLIPQVPAIKSDHRLPLVQLAQPTLRPLSDSSLATFRTTVDALVNADSKVSPFEFALRKIVTRSLALERTPKTAVIQIYSFNAVVAEIGTVLSVLAGASSSIHAADAFAAGAAQLKLIEPQLVFTAVDRDFVALDRSLDKLATASGPIKQRTLLACAQVVSADGSISTEEAELLRAVAAALDCPMPPVAGTTNNHTAH